MIKISKILFLLFLFSLISSCVSGKKITYFQDINKLQQEDNSISNGLKIKTNDLLVITVSAENPESVQPFNMPVVNVPSPGEVAKIGGQQQLQTYLVDSDGNIQFPVLGTISVEGLKRQDLSKLLEKKISAYVKNPIVNIRIANFQVTILGEVNRPGTYTSPDEHLTLIKALGLAGDLTIYGKRQNVLLIREAEDGFQYQYLNLTSSDLFNSPYYHLQQNDVLYVEPIGPKKQGASYLGTASTYLSIASVLTSLILIFTR